jgi:copper(I)-binding protein
LPLFSLSRLSHNFALSLQPICTTPEKEPALRRYPVFLSTVFAGAGLLALAACGEANAPAPDTAVIEVQGAFLMVPAEGRDMTSGGFQVTVTGAPRTLVAAETALAERVELHTMEDDDGVMRMRQVEAFEVTPDAPLVLERGGNHLMLYGLSEDFASQAQTDLLLTFRDPAGTEQTVVTTAEIRPRDN